LTAFSLERSRGIDNTHPSVRPFTCWSVHVLSVRPSVRCCPTIRFSLRQRIYHEVPI